MNTYIPKSIQPLSQWSGGTTRQIYIYPEGSDYASRQFDWRLSSATVECESSTFTPLPGVHRHLMILEGTLDLHHQDHYKKLLHPLEQDEFEGDWQTLSFGKVVDFNLMLKKGHGKIWGLSQIPCGQLFAEEEQLIFPKACFAFLYLHQGELTIGDKAIHAGDFLGGKELLTLSISSPADKIIGVKGIISMD